MLTNYRLYVLALAYALCFGVELTTHNVIALYLFNHFGLSLTASGLLGERWDMFMMFDRCFARDC